MPARPLIQICVQSHQTCDGPMGLMCSVMVVGLCAGCDGSKPTLSSQPGWGWPASLRECLCATPAPPTPAGPVADAALPRPLLTAWRCAVCAPTLWPAATAQQGHLVLRADLCHRSQLGMKRRQHLTPTPTLPLTGGREPDPYSNACKRAAAARSAGNLRCALASDKRAVGACSATAAQVRPLALRTGTATAIKPAMNSSRSQA